jgi:hypothetical protein
MRDILTILDTITEGRGLAARKSGEEYINDKGDIITFQSIDFYPTRGQFNTPEEMDHAIDTILSQTGSEIDWANKRTTRTKAFAIATFDSAGFVYYVGRYFEQISPNRTDNTFSTKDIPGEWSLNTGLGKKESFGYKASEILSTYNNLTPVDIVRQITDHFGQNSDEANAARIFLASKSLPVTVPKGNMNLEAFRDYLCEMFQPIALIKGMNVQGDAGTAADIFLGKGRGYQDCTISFNETVSGGLYDSLLTNKQGASIKLSSKGEAGAKASVQNLLTSLEELKKTPEGAKLTKTYKEAIEIIQTISTHGHVGGPLELAERYGIINKNEAKQVKQLKSFGPEDDIIGVGVLSERLEGMYVGRKARDMTKIIPLEHLLAAIAYRVADYINENTNFGKAASTILNKSALVQMYTKASESGGNIVIDSFNAKYPSEAVTGVLLSASKSYMSTQGKGNFTFDILKDGAKPPKKDPDKGASIAPVVDKKISDIATGKTTSTGLRPKGADPLASKRQKVSESMALGRARR